MPKLTMHILITFFFLGVISTVRAMEPEPLMQAVEAPYLAVNFLLPDRKQQGVNLQDYKGKYVLINFWADWCAPCIKEFPDMEKMYQELSEYNFEVIAIHVGPFSDFEVDFFEKTNTTFTVVIDKEVKLKGWKVPVLPVSYLINPDGYIIYEALGPRQWSSMRMSKLIEGEI